MISFVSNQTEAVAAATTVAQDVGTNAADMPPSSKLTMAMNETMMDHSDEDSINNSLSTVTSKKETTKLQNDATSASVDDSIVVTMLDAEGETTPNLTRNRRSIFSFLFRRSSSKKEDGLPVKTTLLLQEDDEVQQLVKTQTAEKSEYEPQQPLDPSSSSSSATAESSGLSNAEVQPARASSSSSEPPSASNVVQWQPLDEGKEEHDKEKEEEQHSQSEAFTIEGKHAKDERANDDDDVVPDEAPKQGVVKSERDVGGEAALGVVQGVLREVPGSFLNPKSAKSTNDITNTLGQLSSKEQENETKHDPESNSKGASSSRKWSVKITKKRIKRVLTLMGALLVVSPFVATTSRRDYFESNAGAAQSPFALHRRQASRYMPSSYEDQAGSSSSADSVATSLNERRSTALSFVSDAVRKVGPSVLRIDTESHMSGAMFSDDGVGGDGGGGNGGGGIMGQAVPHLIQQGQGSGLIFSQDGLILTNAHVVEDATKVTVTLTDGRVFLAEVRGQDEIVDIAVLKIISPTSTDNNDETSKDPNKSTAAKKIANLPVAELGDSDALQVGQLVIAVGSPGGLDNTVTMGIVSGLERSSAVVGIPHKKVDYIQTDAAINP
jgi:Trypsin-like peptidase domain